MTKARGDGECPISRRKGRGVMHGKLRRMLTKERVWMEKDEQVPFTLWREMKKKFEK